MILTLLFVAVDMLLDLDDILSNDRTVAETATRVFLRVLAQNLAYLVPAATFAAAFVTVAQGARSREILALKAGGVNPLVALLPVFGGALFAGFLLLTAQETIGVRAATELAGEKGSMRGELTRAGAIWYSAGRVIYNARESDPDGERVADIQVIERNEQGRLVRQNHAERARRLSPQEWHFENAVIRTFDPADPLTPPRFERAADTTLQLAAAPPRLDADDLGAMPLPTIGGYVASVLAVGGSPGQARFVFHQRASAPALALLFALLAAPLALSIEAGGALARRALQGVVFVGVFLFLRDAVGGVSRAGGANAVWLPWATVCLGFAFAGFRLARSPR